MTVGTMMSADSTPEYTEQDRTLRTPFREESPSSRKVWFGSVPRSSRNAAVRNGF